MKKKYTSVKTAYPILITYDKASVHPYLVDMPDFNSNTSADTLVAAIEMARNALSEEGLAKQDLGLPIPEPNMSIQPGPNQMISYVDIDLDRYRRLTDSRTIKKTLTIPSYLNEIGNERGINFSLLLTNALKEELGLTQN